MILPYSIFCTTQTCVCGIFRNMGMNRKLTAVGALGSLIAAVAITAPSIAAAAPPKNVIMFIGDGMGHEHIKAAGYYFNGAAGQFSFEQLPNFAWMETNNSAGGVTDSAASATALATGFKVDSDVVSMAIATGSDPRSATPSDGRDLQTILEVYKAAGKSTGIVTNSYFSDATPAAFAAHVPTRGALGGIHSDILLQSRPNVVFGGLTNGVSLGSFSSRGYSVAGDRTSMNALSPAATHTAALFGMDEFDFAYDYSVGSTTFYDTNPFLHEMTTKAISQLNTNTNGFFLMVESDLTDAAGHLAIDAPNKIERDIFEVREMSRAVQSAIAFSKANPDTLIIVTSDHETGAITAGQNNGAGQLPGAATGDSRHNASWVPVYASGPNAAHFRGFIDNTDVPRLAMSNAAEPALPVSFKTFRNGVHGYNNAFDTHVRADTPTTTHGGELKFLVDTDDDPGSVSTAAAPVQTVIRFADLFGNSAIPADATILNANLTIFTGGTASDGTTTKLSIHRLLIGFDENTSFATAGNSPNNGFSLNAAGSADDDYMSVADYTFPAPTDNAVVNFNVTASLIAWLEAFRNGTNTNFGWLILNDGTNGWYADSTDATLLRRPMLEVSYTIPEPGVGAVMMCGVLAALRRKPSSSRTDGRL